MSAVSTPRVPIYFYSSSFGLVSTFVRRLDRPAFNLAEREHRRTQTQGPWVLLTPSYKAGSDDNDTIPEPVRRFLASANNRRRMVGVIGSENRNFDEHYQQAARRIAAASGRPVLFEFELSGTTWDSDRCAAILHALDESLAAQGAAST